MIILHENLKRIRKERHVTQEELAKKLGINRATLSKYENGIIEPSLQQIVDITEYLDASLFDVIPEEYKPSFEVIYNLGFDEHSLEFDSEIDFACKELERRKTDTEYANMLFLFDKLNTDGQKVAVERIAELTEIPKYQKGE